MGIREVDLTLLPSKKGVVVRRQRSGSWKARAIVPLVALVASSLFLAGCGHSATSATCTTKQLIAAAGQGYKNLPPSHDNDAGQGRIPDSHPDADIDANQRAALCKVYKSEKHLSG
jgi:hypothetical protein